MKDEQEAKWGLPDIGIPSEILFHPELTNTEMILFGVLRNLSQSSRGCWATNRFLGKLLRVGPQTISNGVQNLKKWKFIHVRFIPDRMTGENERRIYINPEYSKIYRKLSEAGNELQTGNTALLEEQYRDIKNLIRPHKETYNNEVEREKDSKYNNFMDENLSSKPKRTTTLPEKQNKISFPIYINIFPDQLRLNRQFRKSWTEFEEMRTKQIKAPLTEKAVKIFNKKFTQHTPEEIIEAVDNSIACSYRGIFFKERKQTYQQDTRPSQSRHEKVDPNKYANIKPYMTIDNTKEVE